MRDNLEFILVSLLSIILVVGVATGLTLWIYCFATKINIDDGPYNCIDLDNNTIICEQVWRSHGILYGITEDGKSIDLKSYERMEKDNNE